MSTQTAPAARPDSREAVQTADEILTAKMWELLAVMERSGKSWMRLRGTPEFIGWTKLHGAREYVRQMEGK